MLLLFLLPLLVYGDVLSVTQNNFNDLKKAHSALFVEYADSIASGVAHSLYTSRHDHGLSSVTFAVCLTDKNAALAHSQQIRATPTFKLYKDNKVYHIPGNVEDAARYIKSHLDVSPKILGNQAALDAFVKSNEVSIVGFMDENDRHPAVTLFKQLADEERPNYPFAIANFQSTYEKPSVYIMHKNGQSEKYTDQWALGPLHKWIQERAVPYFMTFTSLHELVEFAMNDFPTAFLLANGSSPDTPALVSRFREIAPELRPHMFVGHLDPERFPTQASNLMTRASQTNSLSSSLRSLFAPSSLSSPHGLLIVRYKGGHELDVHHVKTGLASEVRDAIVRRAEERKQLM